MTSPQCCACGRKPEEILEYIIYAQDEGMTPTEFVRQREGTYNFSESTYACTECYIALGEPVEDRGWKAGPLNIKWTRPVEKIEDLGLEDDYLGETLGTLEEVDGDDLGKICGELEDMA